MATMTYIFRSTYASWCEVYSSLGAKHMYSIRVLERSDTQWKSSYDMKITRGYIYLAVLFKALLYKRMARKILETNCLVTY